MIQPTSANENDGQDLGRRARKARATRQALLNAGLAAFARQPLSLVSVLDITEATDVAKGVFYLHFASKDEFLLALWDDVLGGFLAEVRDAAEASERSLLDFELDADGLDREAAAIAQYARTAAQSQQRVCFALRMASYVGEDIGPPGTVAARRTAYYNALARAIGNAAPDGSSGDGSLSEADLAVARAIDACCWGIIWQALRLGQDPPSERELVQTVLPVVVSLRNVLRSD